MSTNITDETKNKINTDEAVTYGIRKTIFRFREYPFYYFTESDIHASMVKDIVEGNSEKFYLPIRDTNLKLSLVHLEYPTNFKFSRAEALNEGNVETPDRIKQRGNFDLVVLKESMFSQIVDDTVKINMENNGITNKELLLISLLRSIISKDIDQNESYHNNLKLPIGELIDYAIEVKFFHFNNATQDMFEQVKIDNFKLEQSICEGAKINPVNLIFCYYWNDKKARNDNKGSNDKWEKKIKAFRNNLLNGNIGIDNASLTPIPEKVLNIFIVVNVNQNAFKETPRPAYYYNDGTFNNHPDWVRLLTKGYEVNP